MEQIRLFFKCQSCSDYKLTRNIQCPSGHQVCHTCFENLSHCPTCQQRVAPSTRIPILLNTNVDPILNVGDSFDLLLPNLLRIAPALHPCVADEMIFTDRSSDSDLNSIKNEVAMQGTESLADQLLIANNCEVEDTLSRLMKLASMSPSCNSPAPSSTSESNSPPGLMSSSTPLSTSTPPIAMTNNQQEVDRFSEF